MKKLEYFINRLFYVSYYFDKVMSRILYYVLGKPIELFFIKFVPKRFHPPGMKHPEYRGKWDNPYNTVLAGRIMDFIICMNTFMTVFIIICAINVMIWMRITTIFIISSILVFPCIGLSYKFTYKDDKYLSYFSMFGKKSRKWKITSLILLFLAIIESFCVCFAVFCVAEYFVVHYGYTT